MGNLIIMKKNSLGVFFLLTLVVCFGNAQKEEKGTPSKLSDIFSSQNDSLQNEVIQSSQSSQEIEPIVVGRKNWSDPAPKQEKFSSPSDSATNLKASIEELDALETKQGNVTPSVMPIKPPTIPPAVNINRNFEGKLVLKPRKLGFERDFPFQLQNSKGKRLAYIDTQNIKSTDPLSMKDKSVNILGKLEPLKEGSNELVIRARILRQID